MTRLQALVLAACLTVGLAGCQAGAPPLAGVASSFKLGAFASAPTPAPQPVVVAPQAVAPPVAEAPAAPPPRSGGGSSGGSASAPVAPAPVLTGSLSVDLAGVTGWRVLAAQRRVLASSADIDRLIITLKIEGQPDRVQVVTAAQMQSGTTSVSFTALPTGTGTLTIEARDASDAVIGTSARLAPIAQDAPTELDVRTLIVPDDGNYYSYANSVVFGIDMQAAPAAQEADGSGPVAGTVLTSFNIPAWGGLYAGGPGHFYTKFMYMSAQQSFVSFNRFSTADGSEQQRYIVAWAAQSFVPYRPVGPAYDPVNGQMVLASRFHSDVVVPEGDTSARAIQDAMGSQVAIDAAGSACYVRNGLIEKDAATVKTPTTIPAHSAFVIDTEGDFWVNAADVASNVTTIRNEVSEYAPDGTLRGTYALPLPAVRLVSDGTGGVWVGDRAGGPVVRVAAGGTVGLPLGVAASDFCIDGDNHLWVAGGPTLLQLAPDGTQLGSYPIKARTLAYSDGHLFVATEGYPASVLKVVP